MSRVPTDGLIDRTKPLAFRFDGRDLQGYAGDTLASALLANDVRLVARSFKYHRPRGILTAGSEEPNALVELRNGARREPNTRATVTELFDGLEASSQNRFPSLGFDLGAINGLFSPLLVAGFYYKTFMWPAAFWERVYEPLIRRAAGLGRASNAPDPDRYDKVHAFCDVLVIGGGPAGLAAALGAARSGARVILCDEDFLFGGRLNADQHEIDFMPGAAWARAAQAELATYPDVTLLPRTTVFGAYDGNMFGALERVADHLAVPGPGQPRQRAWKIVARRTILAAGAIERPLVFGGNDRPGVMMASAVRTYVNRFAVRPGTRAAIFTSTDDGWRTAHDLQQAGVAVEAIIDARNEIAPSLLDAAQKARLRVLTGAVVPATAGGKSLRRVTVRTATGRREQLDVDLLAMSGGWTPSVALTTHLGGRPRWADAIASFVPGDLPRGMAVVGAATGAFALAESLRQGSIAAAEAVESLGYTVARQDGFRADDEASSVTPLWQVPGSTGKAFVDFQHDVTRGDVELAAREGYRSVELLKRYTTLGMATDQGPHVEHQRPRDSRRSNRPRHSRRRHHGCAAALHAGRDRRLCRPSSRQGVSSDAPDCRPWLGRRTRRDLRRSRPVAARAMVRRARRTRLADHGRARSAAGARQRRRQRRLDPGQDRRTGRRRRSLSRPRLCQPVFDLAGG